MLKKQWTTLVALSGIILLFFFFLEMPAIFGIGALGGGIAMFVIGVKMATTSAIGRPIPFEFLRSREFFLVNRVEFSQGLAFVYMEGGGLISARLVEGVPEYIKEGEIFIPRKGGAVSIVTRREKVG